MPSKLRKAIGAVKDQTSISLAKVTSTNASNLEVVILKATSHDEVPIDDRYLNEVLLLVSSNKIYAASCAQAIARRIGKTRNWIVALKSLMLVLRIFQDGDPYFPREVLHASKRGAKILNLAGFRDDSNSSPWDYTAFVRTFALYLDERLDCFLTGKLQRRVRYKENQSKNKNRRIEPVVRDMKPAMLIDRITYWQKLLDRAIATRPTGAAKTNKLVQISLYAIVQESFDLYRDISDGLALLLDSFFHLQYQSCASAFQICVKASKQFEELGVFYTLCKGIGVGRSSEYPSVQKISDELIETLQEFLKDESSFRANGRSPPPHLRLPSPPPPSSYSSKDAGSSYEQYDLSERGSEFGGSQCTSLEDLMSVVEPGNASPCTSMSIYSEQSEKSDKCPLEDFVSANDNGSNPSLSVTSSALDLVSFFDEWPPPNQEQEQEDGFFGQPFDENPGVFSELVLAKTVKTSPDLANAFNGLHQSAQNSPEVAFDFDGLHQSSPNIANGFDGLHPSLHPSSNLDSGFEPSINTDMFDQASLQNNPFLQDPSELAAIVPITNTTDNHQLQGFPANDMFSAAPTFQATPTFCAQNPDGADVGLDNADDPFTLAAGNEDVSNESLNQESLLKEQQLWLQNQNKIIGKYIS